VPLNHENTDESSAEQIVLGPLHGLYQYGWSLTPDELLFLFRNSSGRSSDIRAHGLRTRESRNVAAGLPFEIPLQLTLIRFSRWALGALLANGSLRFQYHGRGFQVMSSVFADHKNRMKSSPVKKKLMASCGRLAVRRI
jgi:hypothetical protein